MELLPLLLIFAVMMLPLLFLSNRQRKVQRQQQEVVRALGVGDEVRTHSGFYGLIVEAFDDVVVLESEDGTQSKWARQAIALQVDDSAAEEESAEEESEELAELEDGQEREESELAPAAEDADAESSDLRFDEDRRKDQRSLGES